MSLSKKAQFLVEQANLMESAANTMKKRIDENAHGAGVLERSAEETLFKQQIDRTEDARSAARAELEDEGVNSGQEVDELKKGRFFKHVKYELGNGEDLSELQMRKAKRDNAKEQTQIKEKVAAGEVDLNADMGSFRKYLKAVTKDVVDEEERKAQKALGTDGADAPTVAQKKLASLDAVAEQAKQEEQKLQDKEDKRLAKEQAKAAKEEAKVAKLKAEDRKRKSVKLKMEDNKMEQALEMHAANRGKNNHRKEAQKQALEPEPVAAQAKQTATKPAPKLTQKDMRKLAQKASDERKAAERDADNAQRVPSKGKWFAAEGDKEMRKADADQRKAEELCRQSPKCKLGMDMIDRAEAIEQYVRSVQREYKEDEIGRAHV